MAALALACELQITPPTYHAALISNHQKLVEQKDAADYIQKVEDKVISLRKPSPGNWLSPDAFGPKANFSGIDGTQNLFISDVFHEAWVEVNKEGTEAAAATILAVAASAMPVKPPPPPVFRADHPFIFCIRDTRSGSLLFLGRLADPGQWRPRRLFYPLPGYQ